MIDQRGERKACGKLLAIFRNQRSNNASKLGTKSAFGTGVAVGHV